MVLAPPGPLDAFGKALWTRVVTQYAFDDPGSVEVLFQACSCRSRAEKCRKLINRTGEMLGARAHPLIREELANRAACVRLLARLGLDLEPVHPTPGRPAGS
jgi:hypothetical protein